MDNIDNTINEALELSTSVIKSIIMKREIPKEAAEFVDRFVMTCPLSEQGNLRLLDYLNDMRERDLATYLHCIRTGWYSLECGKVAGLSDTECREVMLCGFLHDIGKIGTPKSIIQKPGELNEDERTLVRKHPSQSKHYLDVVEGFPKRLCEIVGAHHEKLDGTGYPDGLTEPDIPTLARIIAIADIYDGITSIRTYHDALSPAESLRIMATEVADGQLDPLLFKKFRESIELILIETVRNTVGNTLYGVDIHIIGLDDNSCEPICRVLTHPADYRSAKTSEKQERRLSGSF